MADEARLTQQAVEVVYTQSMDPEARVTAQYIEVIHTTEALSGQLEAHISSQAIVGAVLSLAGPVQLSVAFTGTGLLQATLRGDLLVGSLLQLTQTIDIETTLNISIIDTLTLNQIIVSGRIRDLSVASNIVFNQNILYGKIKSASVSHTLTLTQSFFESRPVTSILNLTQTIVGVVYFLTGTVTSNLVLTQDIIVNYDTQMFVDFTATGSMTAKLNITGDIEIEDQLNFGHVIYGTLLEEYVTLQSPFEGPEHLITLPKPLAGNTENIVSDYLLKKSMNGNKRTYIKTGNNRRLLYTFSMVREKSLELEHFFKLHNGHSMKLTTWDAEIWKVWLLTNPLSFNQPRRGALCGPQVEIDLEFEGVKISG